MLTTEIRIPDSTPPTGPVRIAAEITTLAAHMVVGRV
jgi:hypothetical protein